MYKLQAPRSYVEADKELRARHCNGCGPKGILAGIVPDTMYGLNISEACNIHDWMYTFGTTLEDKIRADRMFLDNLVRLIHNAGGWSILRRLRRQRARTYYAAVKHFGGPAFWAGKKHP